MRPVVSCIWGKCLEDKGYQVELLSDYYEKTSISYEFNQNYILEKSKELHLFNLSMGLINILKSKKEEILSLIKETIMPLLICKIFLRKFNNNKFVYYVHGGTKTLEHIMEISNQKLSILFLIKLFVYMIITRQNRIFSLLTFMRKITDVILSNNYIELKRKIVLIPNPINFKINSTNSLNPSKTILSVGRLDKIKDLTF